MPKFIPDVKEAAFRCFHLNSGLLFPAYCVIYDPHNKLFAVSAIDQFRLYKAANPTAALQLALFMPNNAFLVLMGEAPPTPAPVDTDLFMSLPPESAASLPTPTEVPSDASGA